MPPSWVLITVGSAMILGGMAAILWLILDWRKERKRARLYKLRWRYVRKPRSRKWTGAK